jgi:hypothetical protein
MDGSRLGFASGGDWFWACVSDRIRCGMANSAQMSEVRQEKDFWPYRSAKINNDQLGCSKEV